MVDYRKLQEDGRLLVLPPKCKPSSLQEDNGEENLNKCLNCPLFFEEIFECTLWHNESCFDRHHVINTVNQEVLEEYPE